MYKKLYYLELPSTYLLSKVILNNSFPKPTSVSWFSYEEIKLEVTPLYCAFFSGEEKVVIIFKKHGAYKTSICERANAYKANGIYVNDANIMMCKHCNCRVEWIKKDNIEKHLKSKNHRDAISKPSTNTSVQSTITGILKSKSKVYNDKNVFIKDTVNMCLKANIPIEKMEHPAVQQYFKKYIEGSGDLPCADHLRRTYLPICGAEAKDEIKEMIKNKPIVIIVDETSDRKGRFIFAVLFKTVLPSSEQITVLASVNFLDTANATICCQTVVDTMTDYNVSYTNIVGLVSDSAPYMIACFSSLKILIGEHILFLLWSISSAGHIK
ncbi:hypothetical protein O3M35_005646 [Rhynocoris fuscipes]|uniref:DUF659 domain-containing protein n=1 Tax=Rhynocoris fuscipes TaxID=488301 RepID=A0AAW1DR07_9HEMI